MFTGYLMIEQDKFMEQKLGYIHCNPLRAGIVATPEEYRYSSDKRNTQNNLIKEPVHIH